MIKGLQSVCDLALRLGVVGVRYNTGLPGVRLKFVEQ